MVAEIPASSSQDSRLQSGTSTGQVATWNDTTGKYEPQASSGGATTPVTVNDETGTIAGSRQLVSGTNTTIDTSTPGQIKVNATGGGASDPQLSGRVVDTLMPVDGGGVGVYKSSHGLAMQSNSVPTPTIWNGFNTFGINSVNTAIRLNDNDPFTSVSQKPTVIGFHTITDPFSAGQQANVIFHWGLLTYTAAIIDGTVYFNNSIFFIYNGPGGDTTYKAVCQDSAGNRTVVDTTITPSGISGTVLDKLEIDVGYTTSGHVLFKINGTQRADISTNLPDSAEPLRRYVVLYGNVDWGRGRFGPIYSETY